MNITILSSVLSFIFGALICGSFLNKKIEFEKGEKIEAQKEAYALKTKLEGLETIKTNENNLLELIKNEFAKSANEVLIEKQKNLQEQNKNSLESFLAPLKERIKEFQSKVEKANEDGNINAQTIKEKIEDLVKQNQMQCIQTEKLSSAISQNSKFRGTMGEMILEKLLKSSGLVDKKENPKTGNYETQVSFTPLDGSGSAKIVDAVIYLSEGTKSIVVDSKASLSEFMNYLENQEEKSLKAFYNDVYDRIKELSNKYNNLEGLFTPDFTIMFIPFEYPLTYIYAEPKLIEHALKQNIIIAGPSTLLATLRTIKYSWAQKNQYENIKDITKLGEGIYDKCVTLVQKIEGVQTSFETVRKKFDEVFKTAKGQGGLIGQVERLKEFGLNPAKSIEEKYLEN